MSTVRPGIDCRQLADQVVEPVLASLFVDEPRMPPTLDALALILGTAAVESRMGRYIRQMGRRGGYARARSPWQVEPATARDLIQRFRVFAPSIRGYTLPGLSVTDQLPGNLYLGALFCRVKYRSCPGALPAWHDVEGQASYWKTYYNTAAGAGRPEDYVAAYEQFVGAFIRKASQPTA